MLSGLLENDTLLTIILGAAILIIPAFLTYLLYTGDFTRDDIIEGQEVAKQNQENAVTVSDQSIITDTTIVQGGPQQQATFADLRRQVEQMPEGYNDAQYNRWTQVFSWLQKLPLPEKVWTWFFGLANWSVFASIFGIAAVIAGQIPIMPTPVQTVGAVSQGVLAAIIVGATSSETAAELSLFGVVLLFGVGMFGSIEYFWKKGEAKCPECETLFSLVSRRLGIESKDHARTDTLDDGTEIPVYQFEGRRILECQNPACGATVIRTEKWKDTL